MNLTERFCLSSRVPEMNRSRIGLWSSPCYNGDRREGFGLTNELDVMIADDPLSFAQAVARLYSEKELWQSMMANGRLGIEKTFTPQGMAGTINESVRKALTIRRADSDHSSRPGD